MYMLRPVHVDCITDLWGGEGVQSQGEKLGDQSNPHRPLCPCRPGS